ncbi:MAG: hypothetical protein IKA20_00500 [Clostridia bacterium]|nr:hypothetical protein [Clostridia bacterium]
MKKHSFGFLKILLPSCLALASLAVGALIATAPTKINAAADVITDGSYKTDGASIRIFDYDGETYAPTSRKGIRFHVQMDKDFVIPNSSDVLVPDFGTTNERNGSYKVSDSYKTYTLILPTKFLTGELTQTTDKVMKIDTTEYWFNDKKESTAIESIAYVYNLPDSVYTMNFSFKGIVCSVANDGTETVVAETETAERCVAYVAKRAYQDTLKEDVYWNDATQDEEAAPLIKDFIPTYQITYDVNGTKTTEEVLWGDTPEQVPTENLKGTWYNTSKSEEIDVTQAMNFSKDCEITLVSTSSTKFVLTGVASHSNFSADDKTYNGVKVYATLLTTDGDSNLGFNTKLDIHAVNVEYQGTGTFSGLQGIWTMEDSGQMRLFFAFDSSSMKSGDKIIVKGDSVFYANGVMYKLSKDYTIDYDGIDYGMFLGYLYNSDIKELYNAPEDTDANGEYDEFTLRIDFYNDLLITDDFTFVNDSLPEGYKYPVYVDCGQDDTTFHQIAGGEYYWNNGQDKILELIAVNENAAYGLHNGDTLYGAPGTKVVQNGGYYILYDGFLAYFLPKADHPRGGVWTVGTETAAYGTEQFAGTGDNVGNAIRFYTNDCWFPADAPKVLTIENMSKDDPCAVYYTSADGQTVTEITEFVYHGQQMGDGSNYKILEFGGVTGANAGDKITIVGGTRFWLGSEYYTIGDMEGEMRTKDLVFCYNGRFWYTAYDGNNVDVTLADIGWMNNEQDSRTEIRLWLDGIANKKVLNRDIRGNMIINASKPALFNGIAVTNAFYYGPEDLVSLVGHVGTKDGDYFVIPAGSVWWTETNGSVTFTEEVFCTYVKGNWLKGDHRATIEVSANRASVSGVDTVANGQTYTFTITPDSGYVVSSVTVNGVKQALSANNSYTFTAKAANTIQVETVVGYEVTFDVPVQVTVNGGAIGNGSKVAVAQGNSLTFSVAVETGYKLASVTNATKNGDGTYMVTPTANTIVTFAVEQLWQVTYSGSNATISAQANGTAIANGAWVENGTAVTFTVSANSGYTLMSVAGATQNSDGTYSTTVNSANVSVSATTLAESALTNADTSISMENRSGWNSALNPDSYYFAILHNGGTTGWLNTPSVTGYWNDNGASLAQQNYGVDIMKYIYINDKSARELVEANAAGVTSYKGTDAFPLTNGGIFAPITVESTSGSGLMIRIMKELATTFTLTFKAGFAITCEHNDVLYVNTDIVYEFDGTNFTRTFDAFEYVDATETIGIENRTDWDITKNPNSYYFAMLYTKGTNGWLNTPSVTGYWNDNGASLAQQNHGVDIMKYIYVNDKSARELVEANAAGVTSYKGTDVAPLTNGGIFAPITVETTGSSGVIIRMVDEYAETLIANGAITFTIKAGFTLPDENGNTLLVSQDIVYTFDGSTFVKQ